MEKAQDYSFNKSHAACYALIAYRTAWLRANHPCEYMAALISSVMNTKDRVPFYVNACHELGIEVLPPDVNESQIDFAVVDGKIRFGLNAVKGVGEIAARTIIRAREEGGPFESIWDFTERVDPSVVNKRALESLVKCGALPGSRLGMLEVLEQALSYGQKQQADRLAGQGSIFDGHFDSAEMASERHHPPISSEEFEKPELLRLEKETLGLYVSEHPLSSLRTEMRVKTDATIAELERRRDGETVVVGGIVSAVKQMTTKRGEPMVFMPPRRRHRRDRLRRLRVDLRDRVGAVRRRPDPDRQGPGRPQGRRDQARCAGGLRVRVRRRAARGAPANRRDTCGSGDRSRPGGALPRVPGREPGPPRLCHLARSAGAEARLAVPCSARSGLLRGGAGAPRRVRARLKHASRRR